MTVNSKKVKRVTDKAILFRVTFDEGQTFKNDKIVYGEHYCEFWVAKSQVEVIEGKFNKSYKIPKWIFEKAKAEKTCFHEYPKSTMRYW